MENRTLKSLNSYLTLIGLSVFLIFGCSKKNNKPTVAVTSLSVNSGPYNTVVKITGTGFNSTAANDQVWFNGKAALVTEATTTQLTATVPVAAGTGYVTVEIDGGETVTGPIFTYDKTATVSTVAGSGTWASIDGTGAAASFGILGGITVDAYDNIYVSDFEGAIRKITSAGVVTTILKNGSGMAPFGMKADARGGVFIANAELISSLLSNGTLVTLHKEYASFTDLVVDKKGDFYLADDIGKKIVKGNGTLTSLTTFAGDGKGIVKDGKGTAAGFKNPIGLTMDASGNLYVVDGQSNLIRKITPDGTVTTIAGSGAKGAVNGKGPVASFNNPTGIVIDADGNLYVGDYANNMIRKITPGGIVSTLAGTGAGGHADGPGVTSTFNSPQGLSFDAAGNLYVAEFTKVRKITLL